ncbi:hypothetical protein [Paenibacillus kandeliae]|uniref:hypothetical protein n=1 Tax=Paenibacillus kandeliae TaxID=3231269 RepID=UPI003458DC25
MEKTSAWSVHDSTISGGIRRKGMSPLQLVSSLLPALVIVVLHAIHMLILPALASSMVMMGHGSMDMSGSGMRVNGSSSMQGMDHSSMSDNGGYPMSSAIPWMEIVMGAIWIISIASILQAGYQLWNMLRKKPTVKMNYICAGFSLVSLGVAVYSIVIMLE